MLFRSSAAANLKLVLTKTLRLEQNERCRAEQLAAELMLAHQPEEPEGKEAKQTEGTEKGDEGKEEKQGGEEK